MLYFSQQLSNGHYGIYINNELTAYVNSPETCKKLIEGLKAKWAEANRIKVTEETSVVTSL